MKIGMTELIVIFVVALFVIGPDRLPGFAKKLGEALAQFRKYADDATKDIKESIIEPLEEAQEPLREAVAPVEELDKAVRGNAKEIRDSFTGLKKKPVKPKATAESDGQAAGEPEEQAVPEERSENEEGST